MDGGKGVGGGDLRALGVLGGVVGEEVALPGGGEVDVGVAKEAGEVVGDGAAAHALVVYHDGVRAAEENVAGLPVAVDEGVGGGAEAPGVGLEFALDGVDLGGGEGGGCGGGGRCL